MKAEIKSIRGHSSLITSIVFSNDKEFMISAGRDGCMGIYSINEGFKVIKMLRRDTLGLSDEEEIYDLVYYHQTNGSPFLIIGGSSGRLNVIDINKMRVVHMYSG